MTSTALGVYFAATLFLAVGVGLLLPRGRSGGRMAGAVLAAAGVGALASQAPGLSDWLATGVFGVIAGVTVTAALATISMHNPVYSAIWFGMTLLGTAGLFLYQGAQFLAVATVVVYAGAILVTFLFVLMLADSKGQAAYDRVSWEAFVSAATGAVIVGILSMTVANVLLDERRPVPPVVEARDARLSGILAESQMVRIGQELFGRHLIAVEVAGTLLLVALVGAAVIVGHPRRPLDEVARESEESPEEETPGGRP